MSPKPKEPSEGECKDVKVPPLSKDESEPSYYYDDAHGYEDFDPANEDEENDESETEAS